MERNVTELSLLLHINCNYNHFVQANRNLVLNSILYRKCEHFKNLSYPFILKGDLKRKGAKFMFKRPDIGYLMFYEILEMLVTDYYSRFKYRIYKTIPETIKYIHLLEVRYIDEYNCDIRSSIIYDKNIILSEKEFQYIIKYKNKLYRSIELSIRNFIVRKISIASTVINRNIELIWDILRNLKLVHKYINLIGNKINYDGEVLKKDAILLILNYKDKNQFNSIAKVNRCKIAKMNLTKESIIELLFQKDEQFNNNDLKDINSDFSISKIVIKIYEFEGKCSMYIIYYFSIVQDINKIEKFTKMKNHELNRFKQMIENYKEH